MPFSSSFGRMQDEYDMLMKNQTWELEDVLNFSLIEKKHIGCNRSYKSKCKSNGTLDKHKARLVAKGFSLQEGIKYEKAFAPTVKLVTIKLVPTSNTCCSFLAGLFIKWMLRMTSSRIIWRKRFICINLKFF